MKKILGLSSCVLIFLFSLTGCINDQSAEKAKETEQAGKSFLTPIQTAELKAKIANQETSFIYIGRPTCPDCQAFQPLLRKELQKRHIAKLAYYNTDAASKKSESALKKVLTKMKIDSVPTMIYLKNGQIISRFSGTDKQQELANWLDKMQKK